MLGEPDKPPAPPAVPGRTKILVSSVIFCVASVLLLLQFLALHCTSYASAASCDKWVTGDLIDWSGAFSCIGWFAGFAVLIDWIVFDTFSAWGPSRRALIGATLKLMASAFFCVEPFSDIAGYLDAVPMPNGTAAASATLLYPRANGVPWSNFVGILFFHTGARTAARNPAARLVRNLWRCRPPAVGGRRLLPTAPATADSASHVMCARPLCSLHVWQATSSTRSAWRRSSTAQHRSRGATCPCWGW
jgi:hypothetical protein